MRKTIRHVAVLAAAVMMLTAIAIPAQSKGGGPAPTKPDVFEVTACLPEYHAVTAVAADESTKYRRMYLVLYEWLEEPVGNWNPIAASGVVEGRGLLEVEVQGGVRSNGLYRVKLILDAYYPKWEWVTGETSIEGVC